MNLSPENRKHAASIDEIAAEWVLRHDRGLAAPEQDEFSQWLAADSRHGTAFARHRWGWNELDRLTGLQTSLGAMPDPDLLAPRAALQRRWRSRVWWLAPIATAAAAMVAVAIFHRERADAAFAMVPRAPVAPQFPAPCERRTLADGSVIDLNRGAAIEVAFTKPERRVRLIRGEANFIVAKDSAHPFIVDAAGVEVRAVGTVFNVSLAHSGVEVLVSEGAVKVAAPGHVSERQIEHGQSATVALTGAPQAPAVATLTDAQLQARLAWQPHLLDFTGQPLADIVAEFNRCNPVQIVVEDPGLAQTRLSATFRSDNIEGFVHLMESDFGMKAESSGDKITLRRAP